MDKQICYDKGTLETVKMILEKYMHNGKRIRIWYGDTDTGRAWEEEHDVTGHVARSTGRKPIAILVHNARAYGGPAILTACIIRIDDISTHSTLYRHKGFNAGSWEVTVSDMPGYAENAVCNGSIHARFRKVGQAQRYIDFMLGNRYNK